MKTDARVRYTNMMIRNSFFVLLREMPLNKITVKRICELSEINRATFYKYYSDPYDLLRKIETEQLGMLKEMVAQSAQGDVPQAIGIILGTLKKDQELYTVLTANGGDSTFPRKVFALCYEATQSRIHDAFPSLTEIQKEWFYYFLAEGCSSILNRWVQSGMKEDISAVSEFVNRLDAVLLNAFAG